MGESRTINFGDNAEKIVDIYNELDICVDDSDIDHPDGSIMAGEFIMYNMGGENNTLDGMFHIVTDLEDALTVQVILDGTPVTLSMDKIKEMCTEVTAEKMGIAETEHNLLYTYLDSDAGKLVMWYEGDYKEADEYAFESVIYISTVDYIKRIHTVYGPIDVKDYMVGLYDN